LINKGLFIPAGSTYGKSSAGMGEQMRLPDLTDASACFSLGRGGWPIARLATETVRGS